MTGRLRSTPWPRPSSRTRCRHCQRTDWTLLMVNVPTEGWYCTDCIDSAARADAADQDIERAFLARLETA